MADQALPHHPVHPDGRVSRPVEALAGGIPRYRGSRRAGGLGNGLLPAVAPFADAHLPGRRYAGHGSDALPLETKDGGYLDFISDAGGFVTFLGWAGNIGLKRPAKYVLVFIDDIPAAIGRPDVYREDLARFPTPGPAGYALRLNCSTGPGRRGQGHPGVCGPKTGRDHRLTADSRVRVLGIFEDRVVELAYGQGVSLPHGP